MVELSCCESDCNFSYVDLIFLIYWLMYFVLVNILYILSYVVGAFESLRNLY